MVERQLPKVSYEDMPKGYRYSPPNQYSRVHPIYLGKYLICQKCRKKVYMVEVDHPNSWRQGPWYVTVHCHNASDYLTISKDEIDAIMADIDNSTFRPMWVFTPKLPAKQAKKVASKT